MNAGGSAQVFKAMEKATKASAENVGPGPGPRGFFFLFLGAESRSGRGVRHSRTAGSSQAVFRGFGSFHGSGGSWESEFARVGLGREVLPRHISSLDCASEFDGSMKAQTSVGLWL